MREVPLGELLDTVIDHRGKTPRKLGGDFTDTGIPVVSAIHIKDGAIRWSERERYVSPEMFAKWMPEKLRKGDVLLTSEAPLGETALVPSNDDLVLSQRLFALRGKNGVLDSRYLWYFLQSETGQSRLRERATGTTVIGIRQAELMKVLVPLPPIDVQRRIAGALGALDDLLEVNRGLMLDIEKLLGARFDALGFDTPGDSRLGDLIAVNPVRGKPKGDAAYIDMAALSETQAGIDRVSRRPASGGARFINGDTVMARITPCLENGKIGFIDCLQEGEVGVGSTEFIVLRSDSPFPLPWAYLLARSPRFRDHVVRHMTGTSGRQRCPADAVIDYTIKSPSPEDLEAFGNLANPLFAALKDLRVENQELRATRNELLPLLMSGRVRVGEVMAA